MTIDPGYSLREFRDDDNHHVIPGMTRDDRHYVIPGLTRDDRHYVIPGLTRDLQDRTLFGTRVANEVRSCI